MKDFVMFVEHIWDDVCFMLLENECGYKKLSLVGNIADIYFYN